MRILVTGGAGFIGSSIVEIGLRKGYDITVLDDFSTGKKSNLPSSIRLVEGSIFIDGLVEEALEDVHAVFHLAAIVGNVRSIEEPIKDAQINILGTLKLLEAMNRRNIKTVIYSSSAAIFGEPNTLPVGEDHAVVPASPYGVSKLTAEKYINCYAKLYGFRFVSLRYFNVYGIRQYYDSYGNVIPIFAKHLRNDQPLLIYGDGNQTRDFVNVYDIARANWLALESDKAGIFNVGTGQETSVNELARLMKLVTGSRVPIEYLPPRYGEVRSIYADITALSQALHFKPEVSLEDGIESYLDWYFRL